MRTPAAHSRRYNFRHVEGAHSPVHMRCTFNRAHWLVQDGARSPVHMQTGLDRTCKRYNFGVVYGAHSPVHMRTVRAMSPHLVVRTLASAPSVALAAFQLFVVDDIIFEVSTVRIHLCTCGRCAHADGARMQTALIPDRFRSRWLLSICSFYMI